MDDEKKSYGIDFNDEEEVIEKCFPIKEYIESNKYLSSYFLVAYYHNIQEIDLYLKKQNRLIMYEIKTGINENNFDSLISGIAYYQVIIDSTSYRLKSNLFAINRILEKLYMIFEIKINNVFAFKKKYKIDTSGERKVLKKFTEFLNNIEILSEDKVHQCEILMLDIDYFGKLLRVVLREELYVAVNNNDINLFVKGIINYYYISCKLRNCFKSVYPILGKINRELAELDDSEEVE